MDVFDQVFSELLVSLSEPTDRPVQQSKMSSASLCVWVV
jgi:hypothetical protein